MLPRSDGHCAGSGPGMFKAILGVVQEDCIKSELIGNEFRLKMPPPQLSKFAGWYMYQLCRKYL